jgi:hypothetical protein
MADGTEREGVADGGSLSRRRWTKAKEAIFFEELAATANVARAVRAAGMGKNGAYQRKKRDPAFAAAWREALEVGFAELEMHMLRHSLNGCERTETVVDGASGEVKQIKTVHSFPHVLAFRLFVLHQAEVARYRQFEAAAQGGDGTAAERVRAEMAKIRARLFGEDDGEGDED